MNATFLGPETSHVRPLLNCWTQKQNCDRVYIKAIEFYIYNPFKKFTDKIEWPACLSACILRSLLRFPSRSWAMLNEIFSVLYLGPANKFLNTIWITPRSVPFKCSLTHQRNFWSYYGLTHSVLVEIPQWLTTSQLLNGVWVLIMKNVSCRNSNHLRSTL